LLARGDDLSRMHKPQSSHKLTNTSQLLFPAQSRIHHLRPFAQSVNARLSAKPYNGDPADSATDRALSLHRSGAAAWQPDALAHGLVCLPSGVASAARISHAVWSVRFRLRGRSSIRASSSLQEGEPRECLMVDLYYAMENMNDWLASEPYSVRSRSKCN
jgi:hypothetical protein